MELKLETLLIRDSGDDEEEGCGAVDNWEIWSRWWMDGADPLRGCKRDMEFCRDEELSLGGRDDDVKRSQFGVLESKMMR